MDRDAQGVKTLVIKRGESVVEEIHQPGKGLVERSFSTCGDYTAHCVMRDDSLSQACEFSVCDLDFSISTDRVAVGEPWQVEFSSDNMDVIIVYLSSAADSYGRHSVFVGDQDRQKGHVVIPAGVVQSEGIYEKRSQAQRVLLCPGGA